MAHVYIRFFQTPEDREPGTVMSMGYSAAKALGKPGVKSLLASEGIDVEILERYEFVRRDETGCSPSELEVILRPPLSRQQLARVGATVALAAGNRQDWVNVVDCTEEGADLYYPYLAQA